MRAASRESLVVGAALWLAATSSFALGFGRASSTTVLGQPLDFSVVLRQEADEFVDAECVSAEVSAGDEKLPRERLRVALEGPANGTERTLRVTSSIPIVEPVVELTLGIGCPVRLSRSFVSFVDPPTVQLAQAAEPSLQAPAAAPNAAPTARVAPPAAATQAPAAVAAAPAAAPRRAAPRRVPREPGAPSPIAAAAPSTTVVAEAPRAPAVPRPQQRPRAPAPRPPGPRLQLEAAASPATIAAAEAERAIAAAAAATAAANVVSEAASQAASREAARSRTLEETLARLKDEAQSTQASLAALRAQVQQAQQAQPQSSTGNPLVYTLAALSALLAVALLLLLWKRSREQDAQWWSDAQAVRVDAGIPSRPGDDSQLDDGMLDSVPPAIETPAPLRAQPTIAPETRPAVAEPRRQVSVEELIDLEQQAEFFAVLGQDQAAIDLLMNHLRGTGGISPLPYLKLLEMYRRRGEREPYERIRERFNRRFNAYAPQWDADASKSRSLEAYEPVMQRLQTLWSDPQQSMDELESLLFRRDKSETFDVPAYGELLFLYSLARDRLERPEPEAVDAVDILLPIGDGPPPKAAVAMISTISLDMQPDAEEPLRIDLELPAQPALPATPPDKSTPPTKPGSERAERYDDGDFSFRSDAGDRLKRR